MRSSLSLLLALLALLLGVGLATSPTHVALPDVALLFGAYALLAMLLHAGFELGRALHPVLGALASLGIGAVLAWHVREQVRVPDGVAGFVFLAVALGLVHLAVARVSRPLLPGRGRAAGAVLLLVVAFPVYVAVAYQSFSVFRWHLLRHHKLIGTPSYFALEPGVDALERRIWERHQSAEDPPTPAEGVVPAPPSAPNLLFVLVDTLRADALAAHGGDPGLMPELNAFAARSLVFTDVLANASWTRPSVASFFTGLLQEHHGAVDRADRLPESAETLAERFRDAGYRTAAFVANFAAAGKDAGFAQGFDLFEEMESERWPYAPAEEMTQAALAWLGEHGDRGPWFLYVHYLDPHTPYLQGGSSTALHGPSRRAYENELRYADAHLARLLGAAEALEDPVVVFLTSDHGEEFGEHGERGHGRSLYREVIHLPAILRAPGVEPGRDKARLEQRDFFDLLDGVRRGDVAPRRFAAERYRERRYSSVYTTTDSVFYRPYLERVTMRSFEEGAASYIWSAYGRTAELYDLEEDPGQQRNLARARAQERERLAGDMEGQVRDWVRRRPIVASERTIDMLRALGYVE